VTPSVDDLESDDDELEFWLCPYLARHMGWQGHDPCATCTFSCYDEPACVTGGPWTNEQYEAAIALAAEHAQ
jgi:hypothetical protein